MSEVRVTPDDLRLARAEYGGFCARGIVQWFKRHNLSYRDFMQNGLPESVVRVDELGCRVADIAIERFENERRRRQ